MSMVLIGFTRFIVHMSVPMEEASASTCLITRPTLTTRLCLVIRQGRRLSALENGLETKCADRGCWETGGCPTSLLKMGLDIISFAYSTGSDHAILPNCALINSTLWSYVLDLRTTLITMVGILRANFLVSYGLDARLPNPISSAIDHGATLLDRQDRLDEAAPEHTLLPSRQQLGRLEYILDLAPVELQHR